MAILENLFAQQIVEKLGWTLIHFVWQGAVVALVLAILLMLLRKSTANLRYIIACGALGLIVVLPVITIQLVTVQVSQPAPDIEPVPAHTPAVLPVEETKEFPASETVVVDEAKSIGSTVAAPTISWKERFVAALEPALGYIVLGWLVGVFGLSVWHSGGWTQLQKLRRKMVKPVDASVRSKLKDLAELLGIHRAVQVMKSALVQVPTVVGWLKPVILLPASSLTGLSPEQLEAILAHELAHIKRCDYIVNILQTVVEILGFYHPAVWWVSHKIRLERENCCDDLAVSVSGPERFARALTSMEEIRGVRPQLAVAASGGSLLERIRRLVGKDSVQETRTGWAPSVIALLLIVTLAVSTTLALTAGKASEKMDVETILEKVRKAQRPAENMRVEWVSETGGGGWYSGGPVSPEKQIRMTRYTGSAVISGFRSRIEERQETYYGKDGKPGSISDKTYVFDGTQQRRLEERTRGSRKRRTDGSIGLMEYNSSFLIDRLFGDNPLLYGKQWLQKYRSKWELLASDAPGVYVVKVTEREGHLYDLITVDGNRGYNIVKRQLTRTSDGSVDYEDKFKLKKYPGGIWFVSGRERRRFGEHWANGGSVEKKMTITSAQFDMPVPDEETFKLRFSEGTAVRDRTFDYRSSSELAVGSLSEPKHTQEDAKVTAILDQAAGETPAGKEEVFGQIFERTINSIEGRKDCFIDFDSARLTPVPEKFHLNMEPKKWFEDNSIDAKVETEKGLCGLWTFHTVVVPVHNARWDSITPAACHRVFDKAKGISPPIMSAEGKLPPTFLFQTWDNRGILQILEVQKDTKPRSIKVRYKLIQERPAEKADAEVEGAWGEAVEGLAVRLRAEGAATAKCVTLLVDARNDGPAAYKGLKSTEGCWLQVDGKWYSRVPYLGTVAPMVVKPGDRQLAFALFDLAAGQNGLWRGGWTTTNGRVPSPYTREIRRRAKPLELTPGRHTVRLALPASGKAYAYSSVVEIEIRLAEKADVEVEVTGRSKTLATLPDGVTVELVGVCEYPTEGKKWWRPDGSPLQEAPYDSADRSFRLPLDHAFEFAVKVADPRKADFSLTGKTGHTAESALFSIGVGQKDQEAGMRALVGSVKEGAEAADLLVGVAAGERVTKAACDAKRLQDGVFRSKGIVFSKPRIERKMVSISVSGRLGTDDYDLVAVDSQGRVYDADRAMIDFEGDQISKCVFAFRNLRADSIREYRLQSRPRRWVKFRNVSLQPAEKADAEPEGAWGEAVGGLQCRLRSDKFRWRQDEIPVFKIDLRHMGADKGVQWAGYRAKLEMEVDGRWYRSRVETSSPPFELTADRPVSEAAVVLEYYHRGYAVWSNEDGYPLDLGPGRHVIRTRMTVLYGRPIDSDVEKVSLVSNPVEIEISVLPERVVHFPNDRSMGKLYVQPWHWELNSDVFMWEELGQAKGDVVVAAGKQLWLQINKEAARDLSPLRLLRPNDIYHLSMYGRVTDEQLGHISGMTGLRQLEFYNHEPLTGVPEGTEITDAQLALLKPLSGLWTLNLFKKDITDAGLVHLESMTSLKFVYLGRTQVTMEGVQRLQKALPDCVIKHTLSKE